MDENTLFHRHTVAPTASYTLIVFHMQGSFPISADVLQPVDDLIDQAIRDQAGVIVTDTTSGSCVRKSVTRRLKKYKSWDRAYFRGESELDVVSATCETHGFALGHFIICRTGG